MQCNSAGTHARTWHPRVAIAVPEAHIGGAQSIAFATRIEVRQLPRTAFCRLEEFVS